MQTIFSHIIQKRFSQVNEDVATDALTFILNSSQAAQKGMMKLLRGIQPKLPELQFRAQQSEEGIRPDLWGYAGPQPHVFIENKFWAGLTENQPVSYLKKLAEYDHPATLLVIVPHARQQTMWRELEQRLKLAGITTVEKVTNVDDPNIAVTTDIGPRMAITSWTRLLSILELECANDMTAISDLIQLRSLCAAADSDAFLPISPEEMSDQRIPALIQQLVSIMQTSVELAIKKDILNNNGLLPQSNWERVGRYSRFDEANVGFWFGVNFGFWKTYGNTPLWLLFYPSEFCRSLEIQLLLEPWANENGIFSHFENDEFALAVNIPAGEEQDQVVRAIVDQFEQIAEVLSPLAPRRKADA